MDGNAGGDLTICRAVVREADWAARSESVEIRGATACRLCSPPRFWTVSRPFRGHRRLELSPDPYRFYAVTGFDELLVYNTARTGAPVARVLYMGRDLGPLLADLRDPPETPGV